MTGPERLGMSGSLQMEIFFILSFVNVGQDSFEVTVRVLEKKMEGS